jgi:hypothetical protein
VCGWVVWGWKRHRHHTKKKKREKRRDGKGVKLKKSFNLCEGNKTRGTKRREAAQEIQQQFSELHRGEKRENCEEQKKMQK